MRRGCLNAAYATVLPLLLLLSCAKPHPPAAEGLAALLPKDNEAGSWVREGDALEFEGEDLYLHIDGGAEIYLEYGFRSVVVQDYQGQGSAGIGLEIYEMAGPESAFGMYSFKTSGQGRALDLGDGAELETYYLNVWKGPYLVTLTGFDEDERTVAGLAALGKAVVENITLEPSDRPALTAMLHDLGFNPGSVRYIRGLLGLHSVYSFQTARGLGFEEGARGVDEAGDALLLLKYKEADGGAAAFSELGGFLSVSEKFILIGEPADDFLSVGDGKNRVVCLSPEGSYLLVGIGADPDTARGTFALVRLKIRPDGTRAPY